MRPLRLGVPINFLRLCLPRSVNGSSPALSEILLGSQEARCGRGPTISDVAIAPPVHSQGCSVVASCASTSLQSNTSGSSSAQRSSPVLGDDAAGYARCGDGVEDARGNDATRLFTTSESTDNGVGDAQREDAARDQSLMLGLILFLVVVAAQSARWTVVIGLVAHCCLGHFTSVLWVVVTLGFWFFLVIGVSGRRLVRACEFIINYW